MSDGDAKVEMLPWPDWPDGHMEAFDPGQDASLDTQHLPDHVVANQFIIALWVGTAVADPRIGSVQAQFVFGDRVNPTDLTADEAEYVRKVLDVFMAKVIG